MHKRICVYVTTDHNEMKGLSKFCRLITSVDFNFDPNVYPNLDKDSKNTYAAMKKLEDKYNTSFDYCKIGIDMYLLRVFICIEDLTDTYRALYRIDKETFVSGLKEDVVKIFTEAYRYNET